MPEENYWKSFFDVPEILHAMEINESVEHLAEFGCGYGTFTIPAAKVIGGLLFAFDLEEEMTKLVETRGKESGLENLAVITRDFVDTGTGLPKKSVEYLMLFNIMHHSDPERIYKEAFRILKPGGKIGIIHWRSDIDTPRGPDLSIRPKPEDLLKQFDPEKFEVFKKPFNLGDFHFGLIL